MHINFTRISCTLFMRIICTLFTCDMYMCRLRHINDPVLSLLKMKGIRLFFTLKDHIRRFSRRVTLYILCNPPVEQ
jgi:hypothetical protein